MDLLCEATINGTLHRVSNAWQTLTHPWLPKIAAYDAPKFGLPQKWGGYARPKWGARSFTPDLFADDWPPPVSVAVTDKLTDTTEEAAVTVFEGTLHLDSYNEDEVAYNSYGTEYDTTVTDAAYTGTLVAEFTAACSTLGLTLDSSAARSPSPDTEYTASGEKVLLDNLNDLAAFFCHGFYIKDGTLYLIDLLADNGSSTLDEFGFFRGSSYEAPQPVSLVKAGDYHVAGSHKYGTEVNVSPVCHTVQANIEAALANIKILLDYDRYGFNVLPEADQLPVIGQKITVSNESLQGTTTTWLRVTDIAVDVNSSHIRIEGFGTST